MAAAAMVSGKSELFFFKLHIADTVLTLTRTMRRGRGGLEATPRPLLNPVTSLSVRGP
ncbi:Hypothetical protein SMAX5B_019511 [Scophthalmus maximus]|uniref:Uncharacterized protein n=1 Tax=Scophthalmus maximus TaxID=52904 RepID=A0A2U9C0C3_SCOMX|nr:Hypothetical protein SMAX5B_019511 [Scophthalmus maximus]